MGLRYAATSPRRTVGMSLQLGTAFCDFEAVASSAAATAEILILRISRKSRNSRVLAVA